jgi:hypothetical protein
MPVAKVAQHVVEVLGAWTAAAKVSQDVIEVLQAYTAPTALTPISASSANIATDGDECNAGTLDAAWTTRNVPAVTGDGAKYSIAMDAAGDAITRSFTDTGQPISIMAHLKDLASGQPMIGICALDNSGNGMAFSRYNDSNTYLWFISGWSYSSTGGSIASTPTLSDHWLHLERAGAHWRGRYSNDGSTWSAWSAMSIASNTISKIGILRAYGSGASQTLGLERFVSFADVSGFTGGVMVSQDVVEVLAAPTAAAQVGQDVIEILMSADGYDPPPGGDGGVRAYGYAS